MQSRFKRLPFGRLNSLPHRVWLVLPTHIAIGRLHRRHTSQTVLQQEMLSRQFGLGQRSASYEFQCWESRHVR